MIFYITYSNLFDDNTFKFWLNHYLETGLDYKIVVFSCDLEYFLLNYPYSVSIIISEKPEDCLELTIYDFLFTYDKDDNDNIILNYNFDVNFIKKSICIGKVFYVPIVGKPAFTTFEIPDFILYQHAHHTNYTVDGIKINGGHKLSDDIVCLSLKETKVLDRTCYLECFNIHRNMKSYNVYSSYLRNIIVNKEHSYAIMWFPKSACTTIGNIFCNINNIKIHSNNKKNLTFYRPKYRFNPYLQGIHFIAFARNPYHRFLSTFIEKHVYQEDIMYLNLPGYKNFCSNNNTTNNIINLAYFIKNKNYISDHYLPIHFFECFQYLINKIQLTPKNEKKHTLFMHKIEDGLNKELFSFFKKYHNEVDLNILNVYENSILQKSSSINVNNENTKHINKNFIDLDVKEWIIYLNKNKLNYENVLTDELKNVLYEFYQNDFKVFGYDK
jgi:hypothetical protein